MPGFFSSPLGACAYAVIFLNLSSHFHRTFEDKEKTICIFETQTEPKEFQMAEKQAKKLLVETSPKTSSGAPFV